MDESAIIPTNKEATMNGVELARQLGKEAARSTRKTRSIKVNSKGGSKRISDALKETPSDGRQQPWTYGGKVQQSGD